MFLRKMKFGILLFILICILTGCSQQGLAIRADAVPNSQTAQQITRFNQLGDDAYNKTVLGDFLAARDQIILMSDLVPKMQLEGITTIVGVKALADTLVQAIEVFNAVQLSPEKALYSAARVRLMADALSHPNTPLWLQYQKLFQEDLSLLDQALKQQKYIQMKQHFSQLKTHYFTILPALQINLQEADLTKLDSTLRLLQNELAATSISQSNLTHALKKVQDQIDELFQYKSAQSTFLPFLEPNEPVWLWILLLSSIILFVLAFAAWRMRVLNDEIITIQRPY